MKRKSPRKKDTEGLKYPRKQETGPRMDYQDSNLLFPKKVKK